MESFGRFTAEERAVPNGQKYLEIKHGKQRVGSCGKVDGGFLVWGKRKPVESIPLAIKQMIDDGLNHCKNEESKFRKMLNNLRDACGPLLSEKQKQKMRAIQIAYKPGDYDAD